MQEEGLLSESEMTATGSTKGVKLADIHDQELARQLQNYTRPNGDIDFDSLPEYLKAEL